MTSRVTRGRFSTANGWSHSWVTATTSSPTPRAKSVSVADGTRETMRMAADAVWREEDSALGRDYEFEDFAQAMAFVNRVAAAAEEANHHPDILVHGWNKVRLTLTTHSEGGLTDNGRNMAQRIDGLPLRSSP